MTKHDRTYVLSGSRAELGALLVGLFDGPKLRYVGKVGTGYTQETLRDLGAKLRNLRTVRSRFDPPPREREVTWVRPALVAQLACAEWTADGKLRQPAFLGLRTDRKPTEMHLEGARMSEAVIGGVRIRNVDKVWWPDDGITKGDVAHFYDDIFERIVPWMRDRPLTAERCPDGMRGQCFYQKNFPLTPRLDPARFTIRTFAKRRADPWSDLRKRAQRLPA